MSKDMSLTGNERFFDEDELIVSKTDTKGRITYANRVGVTIAQRASGASTGTEVEKYLKKSGILEKQSNLIRLDVMQDDADEPRLIEGIKRLISQD